MSDKKYKFTEAGKAYQEAAKAKDQPQKGIIHTNNGSVDIKIMKDGDPDLAKLAGTPYVQEDTK